MKQTGKFFSTVTHAFSSFFGNLFAFIVFAPLAIYFALIFVAPVIMFVLILWEWSFIGERNLLISEQFETEDRIFHKQTELSFSTDVTTQSVIVKLVSPTRSFFLKPYIHERVEELNFSYVWSKLFGSKVSMDTITDKQMHSLFNGNLPVKYTDEEKEFLKKWELQSENLKILRDDFTPISQLLVSLDNCTVESQKDWVCQDQLPFLRGSHSYIGSSDNEWIIDYKEQVSEFSNHQFFNWKTLWWFEKRKCSNFCFIDTVQGRKEKKALLKDTLPWLTKDLPRVSDTSKEPD